MEAYFHNDPRIEEWVGQITEKVFTTCLLTGADADTELQKGSQIVTKVSKILLGISTFPANLLEEGIRQLLEQQLPDDRVIKNFPSFYDILNQMLREGILKALEGQQDKTFNMQEIELQDTSTSICKKALTTDSGYIEEEVKEEVKEDVKQEVEEEIKEEVQDIEEEGEVEENYNKFIIPAFATANNSYISVTKSEFAKQTIDENAGKSFNESSEKDNLGSTQNSVMLDKMLGQFSNSKNTVQLKYVLNKIFPNSLVSWHTNIKDQTFIAQVENLLINLYEAEQPGFEEENFKNEGWKVYICRFEDLAFPRRIEREIRALLRSDKKSVIV